MTGPVHFYRAGRSEPDFIVHDLEKAAKWTIRENEKQEPKLARYRPPVQFMKDARLSDLTPQEERPRTMNAAGLA
jgi:hypothetical protein